jgi:sugar/nucleoside kinase (ribokinase family)
MGELYYHRAMLDLVAVGEAFEDLVFFRLPRLPEPGEELKTGHFLHVPGGGAVITAVAAARLGLTTRLVSALSPFARNYLKHEGVSFLDLIEPDEQSAISVSLSTVDERSFVTYDGVNENLEHRVLDAVTREYLHSRHFHGALFPRDCCRWIDLLREHRRKSTTSSWDFGWNPQLKDDPCFLDLVAELDVFFLNEAESMLYSGRDTFDESVRFWGDHCGLTVVKRGRAGCVWVGDGVSGTCPALAVKVADTTGAGDAFNGGFLYGRLSGLSLEASAVIANQVGSFSTRKPGGVEGLPHLEELL